MNASQVIRLLHRNGWVLKAQKGSHKQFIHPKRSGKITVADHGKNEIPPGTLNAILKHAGLK
jgi:predicted RNA binding protein YcfA (HicA-like mRNA interferase family)